MLSHTNENTCQIRSLTSRLTRREFDGGGRLAVSHTHTHTHTHKQLQSQDLQDRPADTLQMFQQPNTHTCARQRVIYQGKQSDLTVTINLVLNRFCVQLPFGLYLQFKAQRRIQILCEHWMWSKRGNDRDVSKRMARIGWLSEFVEDLSEEAQAGY